MQPAALQRVANTRPFEDLTLIVPTLNEESTMPLLLEQIALRYPGATAIVADDDSTDRTREVAAAFAGPLKVHVIHRGAERVKGLTASVVDAFEHVTTPYFVVLDADLQHPPEAILELYKHASNGSDLAIARRMDFRPLTPSRRAASQTAKVLTNTYLRARGAPTVADPMSGFFAGKTAIAKRVIAEHGSKFEKSGFKVLVDFLKHLPAKARIAEVPYTFGTRAGGSSKLNRRHIFALLRQLGPIGKAAAFAAESSLSSSFWKFLGVGLSGVLINQLLLLTGHGIGGLPLVPASLLAIQGAILWNFYWNDRWSFAGRGRGRPLHHRLARFNLHCAAGAVLNAMILQGLVTYGGLHYLLANLVGIAAATTLNWSFAHHWTWLEPAEPREPLAAPTAEPHAE